MGLIKDETSPDAPGQKNLKSLAETSKPQSLTSAIGSSRRSLEKQGDIVENGIPSMVVPSRLPTLASIFEGGKANQKGKEGGKNEGNDSSSPILPFEVGTSLSKILTESSALLFKDLGGEQFDETEHKEKLEAASFQKEIQRQMIPPVIICNRFDSQRSLMTDVTFSCAPSIPTDVRQQTDAQELEKPSSLMECFVESSAGLVRSGTALLRTLTTEEYDEKADEEAKEKLWKERSRRRLSRERKETTRTSEVESNKDAVPGSKFAVGHAKSLLQAVYKRVNAERKAKITEAQEYYTLGQSQSREKKWKEASQSYSKAVELKRELYGERDVRVACSLVLLGESLTELDEHDGAQAALGEAQSIFEKEKVEEGIEVARESMAILMKRQNRRKSGVKI